jgi:hypothetical protein
MSEEPFAVASDDLRADLMSVPGVASAEVDLADTDAPVGVRVRLTADADAQQVGAEVQRVLAAHGMRSRFTPAPMDPSSAASPEPVAEPPEPGPPPVHAPPMPEAAGEGGAAAEIPMAIATGSRAAVGRLDVVALEERADGVAVRVALDDGRIGSHTLGSDAPEVLDAAVIGAVAAAVGAVVEPLAVDWSDVEGSNVVTVVLRLEDGTVVAGAGVVRVGRSFAVGSAAHAALTG